MSRHHSRQMSAVGSVPGPIGVPLESVPSVRLGAYLRRLREGYGYTLRKVEQRAAELGESIDNSQLSRFEKGKAVPSFEKLRALGRIFNVPVQNFSDVLDLEAYEALKPRSGDYDGLLKDGAALFARGDHGRAFVTFERALEVAEEGPRGSLERVAEARWRMASALKALGKLSMTERELREVLKLRHRLARHTRMKAVLRLSFVYREMGDLYLASILAHESLELAAQEGDLPTQAAVLNALGNIHHDEGMYDEALRHYRRALEILDAMGGQDQLRGTVLINLGGCLVALHRFDRGVARIREAHDLARTLGYRRVAALAQTRLGEARRQRGDYRGAMEHFTASDRLASRPENDAYHDILFLNAFHVWEMARQEGNPTREKIAFGRLRRLRSHLERRFPEVERFDRFVETSRRRQDHVS